MAGRLLHYLAGARNRLQRAAARPPRSLWEIRAHRRGLYRLRGYPGSPQDEELQAKWLAVGVERADVSHESALDLHELSDVIPNSVHLLVDRDDRGIKRLQGVGLHGDEAPRGVRSRVPRRRPRHRPRAVDSPSAARRSDNPSFASLP